MIEATLYDRLVIALGTLVGGSGGAFDFGFDDEAFDTPDGPPTDPRIYPATATQDTDLPFVVYTITNTEPVWSLAGPTGTNVYQFSLEAYGVDYATVQEIAQTAIDNLQSWRTEAVQLCQLTNAQANDEDFGKSYTTEFRIIANI